MMREFIDGFMLSLPNAKEAGEMAGMLCIILAGLAVAWTLIIGVCILLFGMPT